MAVLRSASAALAILGAILAAGCNQPPPFNLTLRVRYLPAIVTGTEHVLPAINIAVAPVAGPMAAGRHRVGGIYNADGTPQGDRFIENVGPIITAGLVRCLSDAGLKPSLVTGSDPAKAFPDDASLMIVPELESIEVNKHFGAEHTVHGQYFTMTAQVRLRFTIFSHKSPGSITVTTSGTEQEPPAPVGGEVFLPLETDPSESVSVALSRAIAELILVPEFRRAVSL